jgi:D-3-phosphoglycerate dehydrogenase
MKQKVFISTVPFGEKNSLPLELLSNSNLDFTINSLNRKLKEEELCEILSDYDQIIAGTEPLTERVLRKCHKLKHISRVGIGLDSVDLNYAEKMGIKVSYTPDAPAPAVAELTIGLMISLLRNIHISNSKMHQGEWFRYFGKRIPEVTIGVIGGGRIGGRVLRRLSSFGSPRILINDLTPNNSIAPNLKLEWVGKEKIYQEADLITLHVPLTSKTRNLISQREIELMKKEVLIVNTSRGGIINEKDLFTALKNNRIQGAAIDVFDNEPYSGELNQLSNCILTSHMGSMSEDCRTRMEIEATEEAIRFSLGYPLQNLVPKEEFNNQRIM